MTKMRIKDYIIWLDKKLSRINSIDIAEDLKVYGIV